MRRTLAISIICLLCLPLGAQIAETDFPVDSTGICESAGEEEAADSQATIDSLLSVWYKTRPVPVDTFAQLPDTAGVILTADTPDSVLIARLEKINSFITIPFNETVRRYMILYSEKMDEKMSVMLAQSAYYFPLFEEILDKYDMPLELKYMSVIESALVPTARSRAGARGIWQFMYTTARRYGLNINSFMDERLDVVKSADAAARYLKDAFNVFGDWVLAISSYNCGAGNVSKAIRRAGGSMKFWDIYPYLPRETRGYVPAFVGAMYAMVYHTAHGIEPGASPLPIQVDTFLIQKNLHFKQVGEMVGVPVELIKELNPQYTHDIIPGKDRACILRLPYNYTGKFLSVQDTLYTHKADSLISPKIMKNISEGGNGNSVCYKVRSGDNLGKIALRYHCSVAQLKKWNHLRSDMIRVGQVLYIYR